MPEVILCHCSKWYPVECVVDFAYIFYPTFVDKGGIQFNPSGMKNIFIIRFSVRKKTKADCGSSTTDKLTSVRTTMMPFYLEVRDDCCSRTLSGLSKISFGVSKWLFFPKIYTQQHSTFATSGVEGALSQRPRQTQTRLPCLSVGSFLELHLQKIRSNSTQGEKV